MVKMETVMEYSFSHLKGFTKEDLQLFRKHQIFHWNDFLEKHHSLVENPPPTILEVFKEEWRQRILSWVSDIQTSIQKLQHNDVHYFFSQLNHKEFWKLFPLGGDHFCYIDIETTGLTQSSVITSIATFYRGEVSTFVKTKNLDDFLYFWKQDMIFVTYNGIRFDLPFIERYFQIQLPNTSIDLMHEMHSLGIKGGLKGAEKILGIDRDIDAQIDGRMAVSLWNAFVKTDQSEYLDILVRYNIADTVNLEKVFYYAHQKKKDLFFENLASYQNSI